MQPLDLTVVPPRSPREQLGGLVMLARSIDKLRAQQPGGNPGVYQSEHGLTAALFRMLGVTAEQLREVVVRAESEAEVVRWLHERTDISRYPEINDRLSRWTLADNPPDRWAYIDSLYPNRRPLPRELVNVFDMLDEDDQQMFGRRTDGSEQAGRQDLR
jgi:hypothetical protein